MNKIIIIKNFFSTALSEANGIILRSKIEELIPELESDELIHIDFDSIRLYASPFFNSCISYLIKKYGPEFVKEKICLDNISELGQKTFDGSFANALRDYENENKNKEIIAKITEKNIEES